MKQRARTFALAAVLVAPIEVAAQRELEDPCLRIGTPAWFIPIGMQHYPETVAELTQQNGPHSRQELRGVAEDLMRSAITPDLDAVRAHIRAEYGDAIRRSAEEALRPGTLMRCKYPERTVEDMVESVLDDREGLVESARLMAEHTLWLATHRRWSSPNVPPHAGVPFDYDDAFDAATMMFDALGGTGADGSGLMYEIDRERAGAVFERAALEPGARACRALQLLRYIADGEPHPEYERLRRESPERCPWLDG